MTEQELHEKIINIIKENGVYNGKSMHRDYYVVNDEELADALIEAGLGDVSEWKHRAKRAEKTMIRLAEKYVDAAKINTIKDVNGKIYFAERQACVTYVATMEMLESDVEDPEYLPPIR